MTAGGPKAWPQNPHALGHSLRRLAPALRRAGIAVERGKGKRREIRLCKGREKTSQTSPDPGSGDDGDVSDDLSGDLHDVGYESGGAYGLYDGDPDCRASEGCGAWAASLRWIPRGARSGSS